METKVFVETAVIAEASEPRTSAAQALERLRSWLREYATNVGHEATCAAVLYAGEDTPEGLCNLGCLDRRSFGVPLR